MCFGASGYAIPNLSFNVAVFSGNISAGARTNNGSGVSAKPAGGQLATTGAIPYPATVIATASLGSVITPNLNDWAVMCCDNTTATFTCLGSGSNSTLGNGIAWVEASAHPLPSSPSSLLPYFYTQVLMKGS